MFDKRWSVVGGVLRGVAFSVVVAATSLAAPPPGYYDSVDTTSSATLRSTLHAVIKDHTKIPYTSSSTDTWDVLEMVQEDPSNANRIIDIYKNASYAKQGGGNSFYNREHSWPKSYGFPNDGPDNYPYSDLYQLFLCDSGYNSARSNKPFRNCSAACTEEPTDANNGTGGGSGTYPGNSNWTSGSFTSGTWEVWMDRRGDIARALFYLDVRYEGGTNGISGAPEPDLILTDNESLIAASNTGSNESVAYMGMLSVLLQWNVEDPVDSRELAKNDIVYQFQGNRNPFVDHPEWVDCLFSGSCSTGDPAPAAPTGLSATAGDGQVALDWLDNTEPDLAGYNIYRATTSGGPYTLLNGALLLTSDYLDTSVVNNTTYYYVATAVDAAAQESSNSSEVSAFPHPPATVGGTPWINELHYDNSGADTGEFVEIAGPVGLDLTGWTLLGYNGNGGSVYQTINLSATITDPSSCVGTTSVDFVGLQNGSPDGLALVDPNGTVVEFISYEGSFTATDGPALGMTSTDIGVAESPAPPAGESLQLGGSGTQRSDFTWQAAMTATRDAVNTGQTFGPCACPGDVNGDNLVDVSDLGALLSNFGMASGATLSQGDLDGDGDVDVSDLGELLLNFGQSCL